MTAFAWIVALPAVIALGAAGAVSSALNGFTGRRIGPLRGTYTFLAVGALISGALTVIANEVSQWPSLASLESYLLLPGAVNLIFIFSMVTTINIIGAMLTTSCIFIGQVAISTWLDHIGFLGLPVVPATPIRIVALLILIGSLALLIFSRQYAPATEVRGAGPSTTVRAAATFFALLLGMGIGVATALNAVLGQEVGTFTATGMFLGPGAVVLAIWFHVLRRRPLAQPFRPIYILPGSINVVKVAGGIYLVPIVGLQVYMAATFTASIVAGMVIDRFGWFDMPLSPITRKRVVAALLLVVGVVLSLAPS